jgi:hypothetical protein
MCQLGAEDEQMSHGVAVSFQSMPKGMHARKRSRKNLEEAPKPKEKEKKNIGKTKGLNARKRSHPVFLPRTHHTRLPHHKNVRSDHQNGNSQQGRRPHSPVHEEGYKGRFAGGGRFRGVEVDFEGLFGGAGGRYDYSGKVVFFIEVGLENEGYFGTS